MSGESHPRSARCGTCARLILLISLHATVTLVAPLARSASAQAPRARADSEHTSLFTAGDAWVAAGFAGATVALFPLDRRIASGLEEPSAQEHRFLHHAATDAELFAIPGIYVLGGGFYLVGRFAHVPWMADAAVHGGEAVLAGTVIAEGLKGVAGRARPYAVADTNPRDFSFGRGFRGGEDFAAFPSVHTVTAFAAASALTSETSRRWPRATWYVAPPLFAAATVVGISRMYHDQHWASDVAVGAAIGTFSGLKVARWNHQHPNNWVDRLLLGSSISGSSDGVRVGWTFETH